MKYSWVLLLIAVVFWSACGKSAAEGGAHIDNFPSNEVADQAAAEMAFEKAFDQSQDGKTVVMEGYLQLPTSMYVTADRANVDFHGRPFQRNGEEISASVPTGTCNNCMAKLPEKYTMQDLKLKADDGAEILANQRVRLTGVLSVSPFNLSPNGLTVSLKVSKIERMEDVAIDYAALEPIKITKENVLDTALEANAFSYIEGKLTIPTMLFMENDVSLNMAVGDQELSINFLFGTGPNQIEEIPENYSKADFKIHDHAGKFINLSKPVKVWGNRTKPKANFPGILYVEHIEQ